MEMLCRQAGAALGEERVEDARAAELDELATLLGLAQVAVPVALDELAAHLRDRAHGQRLALHVYPVRPVANIRLTPTSPRPRRTQRVASSRSGDACENLPAEVAAVLVAVT